jgi:hypothetical protein
MEAELWAAINLGYAKLHEYVRSSQFKGYKTWDDYRAANPTERRIKPE